MTTFVEFLAGSVLALAVVAVVAAAIVGLFSLGSRDPSVVHPTRPVHAASDLAATDEPVAVVGTPSTDSPLATPFTDADAIGYAVGVDGPFGHVTTVRAVASFELAVDDQTVRVDPPRAHAPVVDDERRTHRRVLRTADEAPAATADALAAHDADRSRAARLLSGGVLPGRTHRTYDVATVGLDDPIAVVGVIDRDGDGWRLEPAAEGALRFLDPASVSRHV
jgi:hypothetical protein